MSLLHSSFFNLMSTRNFSYYREEDTKQMFGDRQERQRSDHTHEQTFPTLMCSGGAVTSLFELFNFQHCAV